MKKVYQIAACLTFVLVLSGCGKKADIENQMGTNEAAAEEATKLTVYAQEGIALFSNAIQEYKKYHDEIEVNLEFFEDTEEMESRITAETLSGNGPDVFLFSSDYNSLDTAKMMKNGSFYILDDLMEEETKYYGYEKEAYYNCMIEAGQYGGHQYILPFSFNLMQFYADSEWMNERYPQIADNCTMQEFLRVFEEECVWAEEISDYTGVMWTAQRKDMVNMLLEQSQLPYLDFEGKKVLLKKETVEIMAEYWKTVIETAKMEEIAQKYGQQTDYLKHFTFFVDSTSLLNAVRHQVSWYALSDMKPNVYLLSAWDNADCYTAEIIEYGAVNANSIHPKDSYDLLRTIMDYQVSYDFNKFQPNLCYYLPVNKDNLYSCLQMVRQQRGKGKIIILPLTGDYAEYAVQLEEILENIDAAVIPNPKTGKIVNEVMKPYFLGEEEFDICYDKLINRLKLYLSE